MDPTPTKPVGASDTSSSASAGGRLGYNWERIYNQSAFQFGTFGFTNERSQPQFSLAKIGLAPLLAGRVAHLNKISLLKRQYLMSAHAITEALSQLRD